MDRFWWVLLIALVLAALPLLVRLRDRRVARHVRPIEGPAVLAFTHRLCVPCRTLQAPALDRLRALVPRLRIEVIDVEREPEVARRYGIFTVPATVVIGASGRPLAFNHGLADERKLARQLAGESGPDLAPGETSVTGSLAADR